MSEFRLEAWEEPIVMPCPFAAATWEIGALQFRFVLAKRDKWIMFVRERDSAHPTNWLVLHPGGMMPQLYSAKTPLRTFERIAQQWPNVSKGHLFAWPRARCIVGEKGYGCWLTSKLQTGCGFFLQFEAAEQANRGLRWERVQRELADENSDLYFARYLNKAGQTPYEQIALLYESRSQYDELNEIARLVLGEAVAQSGTNGAQWSIGMSSKNTHAFAHRAALQDHEKVASLLAGWSRFFEERLRPLTKPRWERHYSLKTHPWLRTMLQVTVEEPSTNHERLEGRLRVREWLEHNAPGQIELLLS